jgi:hypothetical protein
VRIINTEGMAFIGPGSEWFWTAVSGLVLAITFVAIWRQLRLQRAATGYAQLTDLSRKDVEEAMLRMKVEILRALRAGTDPTHIPYGAASYVTDFWEDAGALVRVGHFDAKLLYMTMGNSCVRWWLTLQPFLETVRAERGEPRLAEHFEWLAGVMADLNRRDGAPDLTAEGVRQNTESYLRNNEERLRTAESLRTVILGASPKGGAKVVS